MRLAGSAAIVTGAASGIGEATARALTEAGARCLVVDLNEERGKEVATEIGGVFAKADVADEADVAAAVAAARELGALRVLVNAAGLGRSVRTVDRSGSPFPLDTFEFVLRVNLIGAFNCLRLAAAEMATVEPLGPDGNRGAIVNLASVAAWDGQIGQAAYSASKAGIVGMTLPIARDLAAIGVRVNTVAPGLVDTPIYGEGPEAEAFKASLAANVLFPKRLGVAVEVARVIVEVATNDYVNAETIRVDGGIRMPPK